MSRPCPSSAWLPSTSTRPSTVPTWRRSSPPIPESTTGRSSPRCRRSSTSAASPVASRPRTWSGCNSGDDRQGAGGGAQLDAGALADVVAVDLQRKGPQSAVPVLGDRADRGRDDAAEVLDLTMPRCRLRLAEEARDQGRHVALGGPLQDADRECAVVELD